MITFINRNVTRTDSGHTVEIDYHNGKLDIWIENRLGGTKAELTKEETHTFFEYFKERHTTEILKKEKI